MTERKTRVSTGRRGILEFASLLECVGHAKYARIMAHCGARNRTGLLRSTVPTLCADMLFGG